MDYHGANLFVGEEFDGRVGEDSEDCCGVPAEETPRAFVLVDVFHGGYDAEPATGVFCELGV